MTNLDLVLARLDGVRPHGDSAFMARCPAHDDRTPSLSVGADRQGKVLLNCFAGCEAEEILSALDLAFTDLFPEEPGKPSSASSPWDPFRDGHVAAAYP